MEKDEQHDKATWPFGILSTGTRGAVPSQLANVHKLTDFASAHKQGADQVTREKLTAEKKKS